MILVWAQPASAIPGNLTLFYAGLVLLVLGNGFFMPNI